MKKKKKNINRDCGGVSNVELAAMVGYSSSLLNRGLLQEVEDREIEYHKW